MIVYNMFFALPILFLSLSLLGIGPTMSLPTLLFWTLAGFVFATWITWIQFRTEVQKLVQPTRSEFTLSGFLEELPYLQIKWQGKMVLNEPVIYEMIQTFSEVLQAKTLRLEVVNTHPNPKMITAPSGFYRRFHRKDVIGWEPTESKPIHHSSM